MMRAFVGHTDNFNNFVYFFWHDGIPGLQLPRGMISMLKNGLLGPTVGQLLRCVIGHLTRWARGRVREGLART